jgi:hypothetical protein
LSQVALRAILQESLLFVNSFLDEFLRKGKIALRVYWRQLYQKSGVLTRGGKPDFLHHWHAIRYNSGTRALGPNSVAFDYALKGSSFLEATTSSTGV